MAMEKKGVWEVRNARWFVGGFYRDGDGRENECLTKTGV